MIQRLKAARSSFGRPPVQPESFINQELKAAAVSEQGVMEAAQGELVMSEWGFNHWHHLNTDR